LFCVFVLRLGIGCMSQTEKFQRSGVRALLQRTTAKNRGSKPRGAGVNFTSARQFYTNAKL
jgi:hypothetical protein